MTVENAKAFLDELKEKGHSHELMSKIGTDFNADHMTEALEAKGTSRDELLKAAAGGSTTSVEFATIFTGGACAGAAGVIGAAAAA